MHFGLFGGAAGGGLFSYDPMDQGCHPPEFVGGVLGEGEIGFGKHLGVSSESDFNGESSSTVQWLARATQALHSICST